MISKGSLLQHVVNGEPKTGNKVFDLVAFDPRGVANSTPRISCFSNIVARQLWYQLGTAYGSIDSSNQELGELWARAHALGQMCDPGEEETDEAMIISRASTAYAARDMLEMVERSGEAREKEMERQLKKLVGEGRLEEVPSGSWRNKAGTENLQYWGFSYGGSLGGTFASLYPDRVGRMVLDGCGDFDDWTSSELKGFLTRTDRGLRRFYETCYEGGPGKCALYNELGPLAIEDSVTKLLDDLRENPLPVWDAGMTLPDILTRNDLISTIFSALYSPYELWEPLAETLSLLSKGNTTAIKDSLPSRNLSCSSHECGTEYCVEHGRWWREATTAIMCSDGEDIRNETRAEFISWLRAIKDQSPLFGPFFASTSKLVCTGWQVRPKWRYPGPFSGKTKTPILFIGNTADPVAPLEGTGAMARAYEGAVLLTQDSAGHCSMNSPSVCTMMHVRRYFQTAELPQEGTVCKVDRQPFADSNNLSSLLEEHEALAAVVEELARSGFHY